MSHATTGLSFDCRSTGPAIASGRAAYLSHRYRTEFEILDAPAAVRRLVFPAIVAVGKRLGLHRRFAGAPEAHKTPRTLRTRSLPAALGAASPRQPRRTVIEHFGPGAPASRASAVRRSHSSASAKAT